MGVVDDSKSHKVLDDLATGSDKRIRPLNCTLMLRKG